MQENIILALVVGYALYLFYLAVKPADCEVIDDAKKCISEMHLTNLFGGTYDENDL